jgi:hypothetical protein
MGNTNTVQKDAFGLVGYSIVTLPGLAAGESGQPQVTAYGNGNKGHCKVLSWEASGSDAIVEVMCWDTAGNAISYPYALTFSTLSPVGTPSSGYALHNDNTQDGYTPANFYRSLQFNGVKKAHQSGDLLVGNYDPGTNGGQEWGSFNPTSGSGAGFLKGTGSGAMVTSFGDGPGYCKIVRFNTLISDVDFNCFDRNGNAQDSDALVAWVTDQTQ